MLTAENYKPHTQLHPKKKENDLRKENIHKHKVAKRLFDAMSEMKNIRSFLVYNFGSRKGPIANAKSQLQNGMRSFLTYFSQVAKANRKRKTATSAKNSDISTYANFPPHDMKWWCYVNVSLCGMHACVCENVYVIMVNTVMSVSKPA